MSNSSLVTYTKISPFKNERGNSKIDTITIHHAASVNVTGRQIANSFAKANRNASANYCIGVKGDIALSVPEDYRAWTSGDRDNDYRAITIEVANSKGEPNWEVSDASLEALILLLEDICKRNNIKKLFWKNNKSLIGKVDEQNMTVHQWFQATACPGPYLMSKMGEIADAVNSRLGYSGNQNESKTEEVKKSVSEIAKEVVAGKWGNGAERRVKLNDAGYDYVEVQKEVNKLVAPVLSNPEFKVKVDIPNLNIRKGPGTNYVKTGTFTGKGIFTITETKTGTGSNSGWGKLKSGAGWISLDFAKRI